jgi:hypothetical protein
MKLHTKTIISIAPAILKTVTLSSVFLLTGEVRASEDPGFFTDVGDYFANWFDRVDATSAKQPHWASPLVTTSGRLLQQVRYDIMWQSLKGGHELVNYGGGKGLEFIPAERLEFCVGIPPWESKDTSPQQNGWGDQMFFMKYRIAAANEQEGNYILSGLMGVSVPNGSKEFSTGRFVYSPTLAGGKGWGDFNIQGTIGTSIPDNGGASKGAGTPLLVNCALQYNVAKVFWPQVEANYTYWPNGTHEHLNQLFITPGVVIGKFPIYNRLSCMLAVGCQVAVTENPLYHRSIIFSSRFPF